MNDEIRQPTHAEYTFEHVSNLWPRHPIYQFQNDTIEGTGGTDPTATGRSHPHQIGSNARAATSARRFIL